MWNDWQFIVFEATHGTNISYLVRRNDSDNDQACELQKSNLQIGSENNAFIMQINDGSAFFFEQEGNRNQIIIFQSDSLGWCSKADVKQRGTSNRATIIQRN